jgi:hypothetical protein
VTAPVIAAGSRLLAETLEAWRAVINGKITGGIKTKTADTTRASTTTYAADPHLVIAVAANTRYIVEVHGVYQAAVTPQIKFQMTFPSGTLDAGSWEYDPGTDDWQANVSVSSASPASFVVGLAGTGGNVPFRLTGSLAVGATGGNLSLDWAQNVSNATGTILRKGTWLRVTAET